MSKEHGLMLLDTWLKEYDEREFFSALEDFQQAALDLADCECRTKHACCPGVYEEGAECTWTPCPDCEATINGYASGTWTHNPGIHALAHKVDACADALFPVGA